MYNGVGVSTARGTGTNGHVSTNRAKLPKHKLQQPTPVQSFDWGEKKEDILQPPVHRNPNPEILEMDRKRQLENKVYEWAESAGILDNDEYV
jgi:serine/arginine repetitive matrix protein 2